MYTQACKTHKNIANDTINTHKISHQPYFYRPPISNACVSFKAKPKCSKKQHHPGRRMFPSLIYVCKLNAADKRIVHESQLDPVRDFAVTVVGELDISIQSAEDLFRGHEMTATINQVV